MIPIVKRARLVAAEEVRTAVLGSKKLHACREASWRWRPFSRHSSLACGLINHGLCVSCILHACLGSCMPT
ncbi:hypothetical protein GOP47_0007534 [Adiantum capillus-veneris]|uniref:Uncharacterized protein n=1 Tax=Adiantum capillus-veneris TaxID=13818 RepID=A0A9D4ZM13_ADICA|nr:hypothetical protein GOP47_0007534 [Adiantum capillus-veneris]